MLKIDFVSDIACPWCAVGLNALEGALRNLGSDVPYTLHMQPFELNPNMASEGVDAGECLNKKYGRVRRGCKPIGRPSMNAARRWDSLLASVRASGIRSTRTVCCTENQRGQGDLFFSEDYCAAASVDLEHDRADRVTGKKIACLLRVIWGEHDVLNRCFLPIADRQRVAEDVLDALPCGHYIPEEVPAELLVEMRGFFR